MKCSKCGTLLSPFLLRQVHKQDGKSLFEIECLNPNCRFLNIVSEEFYYFSKKDYLHHFRKLEINNNLPGESNVMFVSMDRCGISWIVRRLSRMHEYMFGVDIDYFPEISRVIATRQRFPLPEGWYNVYEVDPQMLLDRGYDKIVSIQRPLEIMYRVLAMYYKTDLTYEQCREQYPTYFEKIDKYYELLYEKANEINDVRYKNFSLNDLNNYTCDTFNELMDFLNFPKHGRPVIFPVNPPERNWQAYSSTLLKTEPIGMKLRQIQEKYEYGDLEIDIQKNRPEKQTYEQFPPAKYRKPFKPPKIGAHEKKVQNGKKFRIYTEDVRDSLEVKESYNILIITPIGYGLNCHLGENMVKAFKELGHKTGLVTYKGLRKYGLAPYKRVLISSIINTFFRGEKPDLVFINEVRTTLINDLELPIFYFHTGWYLPLGVIGKNIINYFRQDQLLDAYNFGKRINKVMYHAVNPEIFYPQEKTIKGVCGIGFRRPWEKWKEIVGSLKPFVEVMEWETKQFINLGFKYFHTPVNDLQYRELLRKMEALNPLIAYAEYITRRMLEGMACKTLLVYRLDFVVKEDGTRDTSVHRNMLEGMGYFAGVHYIEIKDNKDIKRVWDETKEETKEEMREKAYKVTLERHTHVNRAKQVINDFESGEWKNGENE